MTEHEAVELSKNIDDELTARVINDEIDAHIINDDLAQVAETFDSLTEEKFDFGSAEHTTQTQENLVNFWKSKANHQPGHEHVLSDTTYVVSSTGAWIRKTPEQVTNPNLKNKQTRNKLLRHPKKYAVVNL